MHERNIAHRYVWAPTDGIHILTWDHLDIMFGLSEMHSCIFYPSQIGLKPESFLLSRHGGLSASRMRLCGLPFAYPGPRFGMACAERPELTPTRGAYEYSVVYDPCSCTADGCHAIDSVYCRSLAASYTQTDDKKTSPIVTYEELLLKYNTMW